MKSKDTLHVYTYVRRSKQNIKFQIKRAREISEMNTEPPKKSTSRVILIRI